jgi:hypothetical protein
MEIGGWKTRSVFERYAIVDSNDIRNGVKKLEASRESYSSATVDPVATPAVGQQMIS